MQKNIKTKQKSIFAINQYPRGLRIGFTAKGGIIK